MIIGLKNHPFAVEAFFESSLVLTFAAPKEQLESFIPESLELDVFNDHWAFIAMAMVTTRSLRPKGFPAYLGRNFFLIGYRVFVRYQTSWGKRLRGLYILRSETDKRSMELLGNMFTHYKYHHTDVVFERINGQVSIYSERSGFNVDLSLDSSTVNLPGKSPFDNWKEARRYAGPLPFTFSYNRDKREMLIIEGKRQNWEPRPVEVNKYNCEYIDSLGIDGLVLANAFAVEQIPYLWNKGIIDKWQNEEDSRVF